MPPYDFGKDHPYYEAMHLMAERRPEEALALLQTGDPKWNPGAYEATLADVFRALGRTVESGERARRALELGWDTPRVRTILGQALWNSGLHEEAVAQYERAGDETAFAAYALGWAAYNAGDFPSAERHAARALELNPGIDDAHPLRLAAQAAQGDPVARKDLRELWTESGRTGAIEYLVEDARRRKALPELDDLLPGFLRVFAHDNRLAAVVLRLLMESRGRSEGLRVYQELPESLRDTPDLLFLAGWALGREGRPEEGVRLLERAFEAEPTSESIARTLGKTYNDLRRPWASFKVAYRHAKATLKVEDALKSGKKAARRGMKGT